MSASSEGGAGGAVGGGGNGSTASTTSPAHSTVAKITHVKPDGSLATAPGAISITGTPVGSTIKVSAAGGGGAGTGVQTALSGPPIALNATGQATTAASIRAIGAGGQSTQVRVVMPMIKQVENVGPTGRTQITAIPATPARSVSNASITVTRPVTQTYLPRASVTATQMGAASVGATAAQRLVTPLRAVASTASVTPAATGLTTAGTFVRGTSVSRGGVSQTSTTVISSANSTAWLPSNSMQLIRAITHQPRQRIITTTQGLSTTSGGQTVTGGNVAVSGGSIMTTTTTPVQTPGGATALSVSAGQALAHAPQPSPGAAGAPQAYVAAVLPPRQHQATLVYSSNVAAAPTGNPNAAQQQQFNQSVAAAAAQRFSVATPLGAGAAATPTGTTVTPRQVRPIPLGKSFPTSISIRAPSIPQLSASLGAPGSVANAANATPVSVTAGTVTGGRGAAGTASVSVAPVLTTTNLPTTRIIQLQQPATGAATQQIIGSTTRLTGNVMLQPILMSTAKMGIRPPVTMTAKVQPSLTITQLNPITKIPAGAGGGGATNLTAQGVASIQAIGSGATATLGAPSNVQAGSNAATVAASAGAGSSVGGAQLVSVSQGAAGTPLLNTTTAAAAAAAAAAGGATSVLPLAISTRGGPGSHILTGTLTPIKNANITVGKMMTQSSADSASLSTAAGNAAPTSVFIQQRAGGGVTVSTANAASAVASSSVTGAATAFLPPGSATIYYESMPASSVQVSTGVLSLATTTVTQSTHTHTHAQTGQLVSSSDSGLSVSTLPFASHANTGATFTVAAAGRAISQLQLPGAARELNTTLVQAAAAGGGQQLIIPAGAGQPGGNAAPQHMVIPIHTSVKVTAGVSPAVAGHSSTAGGATVSAVPVPVPVSGSALVSSFMRKREADGSPIRAAKNLAPTLLSMSSNTNAGSGSGILGAPITGAAAAATSVTPINPGVNIRNAAYNLQHVRATNVTSPAVLSRSSVLTVEALAKKEHASSISSAAGSSVGGSSIMSTRNLRADSPASSDGSTTVSANSSPGVEQQMQDSNLIINRTGETLSARDNSTHFNPINELYPNLPSLQTSIAHAPTARGGNSAYLDVVVAPQHLPQQTQQPQSSVLPPHLQSTVVGAAAGARMNGNSGSYDGPTRKKTRRSTSNDSQHSTQSQASLSLPPPTGSIGNASTSSGNTVSGASSVDSNSYMQHNNGLLLTAATTTAATTSAAGDNGNHRMAGGNVPAVAGNKENANPVDFVMRRRLALLNTYKPTHKLANNHFHRYTDIKPREERRASVMDLANQPNVQSKINGWKIHHLRSQMEDLNESEMFSLSRMESILKQLEKDKDTEKNAEMERITDLLKGNIQRSKIITDGINDAQNLVMKIFDHKPHVSDIINRCASKRNFKKREKM